MSNLGEGLAKEREAIGYKKGCEEEMNRIILRMHEYDESLEKMMRYTGKSEHEIKDILNKYTEE